MSQTLQPSDFAPARGTCMSEERATEKYRLSPSELRTLIKPTSANKGAMYNVSDAEYLQHKIRVACSKIQSPTTNGVVPSVGPSIEDRQARRQYKLDLMQLRRILPCHISPTLEYNISDVESLSYPQEELQTYYERSPRSPSESSSLTLVDTSFVSRGGPGRSPSRTSPSRLDEMRALADAERRREIRRAIETELVCENYGVGQASNVWRVVRGDGNVSPY
ncbi:hypothetical protein BC629DRAFT_1518213 [Irpex lacteus]|nr:hypothetical protein BC629DRAFT_1518213 [Irpex lacteus]